VSLVVDRTGYLSARFLGESLVYILRENSSRTEELNWILGYPQRCFGLFIRINRCCGSADHWRNECPKNKTEHSYTCLLATNDVSGDLKHRRVTPIMVDSGATSHMKRDIKGLTLVPSLCFTSMSQSPI
jgi:hypothetical protein